MNNDCMRAHDHVQWDRVNMTFARNAKDNNLILLSPIHGGISLETCRHLSPTAYF
ncbi:hypothetical protein [Candidimonas sp. SYP-B2681]|uniref:hypothetical protein n=1 Tax=Candidimonas sp. SYP-B2681 TaxID=2497686 RepID=UPI001315A719|nr:hypothetical protein [Candidimonas sp. SYP-B2681]